MRCDGRPGGCVNCERLQLVCVNYNSSSKSEHPPQPQSSPTTTLHTKTRSKRKRTYRSCADCRASKTRCSGDQPACHRCSQKKMQCVYEAGLEPAWEQRLASVSGQYGGTNETNGSPMPTPADHNGGQTGIESFENQDCSALSWCVSTDVAENLKKLTSLRLKSPNLPQDPK